MANNRCPICGANHKTAQHQCRLCGAIMDDTADTQSGVAVKAVPATKQKSGLRGLALVGVITVLVIAMLAIVLGFTTGELSLGRLRNRVPFLKTQSDGWVKVEDAEGGFTVDMPSSRQTNSIPFASAQNERLTGWSAAIDTDTTLFVDYGKVTPQSGETAKGTLNRLVDEDLFRTTSSSARGATSSAGKRTETDFRGYPAIVYELKGIDVNGQYGYEKAVMFLKGDVVYWLASQSIYKDHPQFDRLTSSFQFTA